MTDTKIVNVEESKVVNTFITDAIAKGLPVETMEKLFALREKVKAEYAKEEFMSAMANFQRDCPVIEKTKKVFEKGSDTKVRYAYADLGGIVEQVKKPLAENKLSYDFITEEIQGTLKVTCTVTHALGHSKSSSFQVPIGAEAYMSDVQKYGARVTFAKRYAFCNALGILTADEDTDSPEDTKVNTKLAGMKEQIEKFVTIDELAKFYKENQGLGKEFAKMVTEHKNFILNADKN
jgi:hypothetical protein